MSAMEYPVLSKALSRYTLEMGQVSLNSQLAAATIAIQPHTATRHTPHTATRHTPPHTATALVVSCKSTHHTNKHAACTCTYIPMTQMHVAHRESGTESFGLAFCA